MQQFNVVDLESQIAEIIERIEGFTNPEIISWLQRHGKVHFPMGNQIGNIYRFTSTVGISTNFRLTDSGEMYLLRDHTLERVR